jgi:hypothetical protein
VRYELIDSPTELALQLVPPLTIIDGQQIQRPQAPPPEFTAAESSDSAGAFRQEPTRF